MESVRKTPPMTRLPTTARAVILYELGLNFLINEQPDRAVDVFIKMLEVDSDTVETHLALGSLFRRRSKSSEKENL